MRLVRPGKDEAGRAELRQGQLCQACDGRIAGRALHLPSPVDQHGLRQHRYCAFVVYRNGPGATKSAGFCP